MILAHEVAGSGPALLLVHAGIADRRMWGDQVGPFADAGWMVVRADLPGFGETPLPDRPVALWVVLRDLLDHLEVERAVVAGCSLEEPALFELWDQSEGAAERGDLREAARVEVDTWVVGMDRDPGAVDPEVRRRVTEMLLVAYTHGEAELEEPDPPAAGRLGEVAAPTLVLVGEHDRPDIHAIADALAGGIPRAERAAMAGTGHLPSMERPAEFNRVVLEFLAGLDRPA